jgi:hypothetical protein
MLTFVEFLRENTSAEGELTMREGQVVKMVKVAWGAPPPDISGVHGLVPVKKLTVLPEEKQEDSDDDDGDKRRSGKKKRKVERERKPEGKKLHSSFLLAPLKPTPPSSPDPYDDKSDFSGPEPAERLVAAKYVQESLETLVATDGKHRSGDSISLSSLTHLPSLRSVHVGCVGTTELMSALLYSSPTLERLVIDSNMPHYDKFVPPAAPASQRLAEVRFGRVFMSDVPLLLRLVPTKIVLGPDFNFTTLYDADKSEAFGNALIEMAAAAPRRLAIVDTKSPGVVKLGLPQRKHLDIMACMARFLDTSCVKILDVFVQKSNKWPDVIADIATHVVPHLPDGIVLHLRGLDGVGTVPDAAAQRMKLIADEECTSDDE